MNILREVRRAKEKSMTTRIILVLLFSVIFVVNTYAWFEAQKEFEIKGIEGDVTSWDVAYYVDDNEILNETATFTIDELYPGMPNREDLVHIYNIGKASTNINCEVISVKVFGQEVLEQLKTSGEIKKDGNTTYLFSKDTQYPFSISFTYDKEKLIGEYSNDASTPNSFTTFRFNASWEYEGNGTVSENEAKDILDTKFGKNAYAYYQDNTNATSKAIEIQVKITSRMIHPSVDSDYVE